MKVPKMGGSSIIAGPLQFRSKLETETERSETERWWFEAPSKALALAPPCSGRRSTRARGSSTRGKRLLYPQHPSHPPPSNKSKPTALTHLSRAASPRLPVPTSSSAHMPD